METATITRDSLITGRPFTRTVTIVREWSTYNGIEQGRPVVIQNAPGGPQQYEVLSAAEQATITR